MTPQIISPENESERSTEFNSSKNVLRSGGPITKVAVLELSTRACKLLVADIKILTKGFNWQAFKNDSHLTNTGHLIDSNGNLPWQLFKKNVLPTIKRLVKKARSEQVDVLYCVATAAIRSAQNRDEILKKLKKSIDLNVQILDQEQESEATIQAFRWGTDTLPIVRTILMDQGGGSTELSAFSEHLQRIKFESPTHFAMGTTSSIEYLFRCYAETDDLKWCLLKATQHMEQFVNRATYPFQQADEPFQRLIGLGSALTDATQKKSNQFQHNTRIDRIDLLMRQEEAMASLLKKFNTVAELKAHMNTQAHTCSDVQRQLVSYFGLGMVVNVLDRLNLHEVTVYGIGLRYGVCHQQITNLYPQLTSQPEGHLKALSTQLDGLQEGSWITGTISNIDPRYGVFVRLNKTHTGLVHIKILRRKKLSISSFRRKDSLRVYVKRITRHPKPKFYLLLSD